MTYRVTIRNTGETIAVEMGQTVLEAALGQGVPYPHGCRSGNCGACKSELASGEVEMSPYSEYALTDAEKAQGLVLACRSVPWSDAELRWLIVRRLAAIGAIAEDDITAEHARDVTSTGAESAATARAALPSSAAKAAAWEAAVESDTLSNHMIRATMRGFWQVEQLDLLRPYVDRYFSALPATCGKPCCA